VKGWSAIRTSVLLLALSPWLAAQQTPSRLAFDVVSVRPAAPELHQRSESYCASGGRFIARGVPLVWAVQFAYDINDYQVGDGWPEWMRAFDTYDIEATAEKSVTEDECRRMAQSLLEERFRLRLRRETKTVSGFALVAGKKGPRFAADHVVINGEVKRASFEREPPPGWTMARLANYLASVRAIQRPVIDRTNVAGIHGFTLDYSVSERDDRPDIFLALRSQLGLTLQSVKVPLEIWFVEHAERPGAN